MGCCNPATLTSSYGVTPDGDGSGSNRPPVIPLPIPPIDGDNDDNTPTLEKSEVIFWFDHLKDFHPGDDKNSKWCSW